MKFTVEGADRKTGDERSVSITALDIEDAQVKASQLGLLVSKVSPRFDGDSSTPPPPPRPNATSDAIRSAAVHAAAVKVVAPDYLPLKILAMVFRIVAFLCYAGAVVCLVLIPGVIGNDQLHEQWPQFLVGAIGSLLIGVFYHGVSAFLVAFRDLTRNSFK